MSKRILIIDDEDDIREIAQLSMELGGWEVHTAATGADGAQSAASDPVDVILLDVMMPGLDGVQTLELLRSDPLTSDIPVIFLTAKAQSSEQRQLEALRTCGMIAKPFDPMTLADEVLRLVSVTR